MSVAEDPATRNIVPLAELGIADLPLAGGKAMQLGVMMSAGLPVPAGFSVTTAAYRRGWSESLAAEVEADWRALGAGPVAVRSSATAEDLPEASFAGQQDTFLNVSDRDAVLDAVRACWQSLFTERAVAYRRDRGIPDDGVAMAVVVQRMVQAEVAGVLFTLNPVSGALDEMVVEAACGLGDQVVSAHVTPDRYRLRRRAPHEVLQAEGRETATLLVPERLAELARLGLAAERLLGRAADIEWAIDANGVWLLQARAVTAAGPRLPEVRFGSLWNEKHCRDRLIVWSNHNVRETMPYPHTPFSRSFWHYLALPSLGVALGILEPEDLARLDEMPTPMDLVDGRIYWNMNITAGLLPGSLMARATRFLDVEVADTLDELFRTGELESVRRPLSLRRLLRTLWRVPRGLAGAIRVARPEQAWRHLRRCKEEVDSFSKMDLRMLREEQILGLARYFATQNMPRGFEVLFAMMFGVLPAMLYLFWSLPRWGFPDALPRLMSGIPGNPTVETALALWDIAEGAGPEVRAVFAGQPIESVPQTLQGSDSGRDFLQQMAEFLQVHGHRAVREFDFSCPRWREDPTFLYETIRNYLTHPADQPTPRRHFERQVLNRKQLGADIERRLRWRPLRRLLFRWSARMLEKGLPLREAPKFYMLMGAAHIRDLYLEVGRRLVTRGILEKTNDFFFLSIPELERIAAGHLDAAWVREQIPIRRLEFAEHMRANPPLVVRSDGKPVGKPPAASGSVLRGTPASWGVARGPVRILMDPGDGALLHKGEILVAPFTDPGWTPLFLTAGALVMEIGGVISHGAVVAREYGIPAVVGLKDATRLLRDGELVEVNGATGEVRRLATPSQAANEGG